MTAPRSSRAQRRHERRRRWRARLQRLGRWAYLKLVRAHGSPHEVSLAFAAGLFIGIMPFIGPFFAIAFSALARLNVAACLVGVFLTNPFAFPFFYVGGAVLGAWLFGLDLPPSVTDPESMRAMFGALWTYFGEQGWRAAAVLGAGYGILAGVPSVAGYGAAFALVSWYRRRRASRRAAAAAAR